VGHAVGLGEVGDGARLLTRVAPLGPVAVHLAVIDPGVGTSRRPLLLRTRRGDCLVGPDNGLLVPAAAALGGVEEAWELDPPRVRGRAGLRPGVSRTFHGRDVFAPAAALVARGEDPASLGDPAEPLSLVMPTEPLLLVEPTVVRTEVIEVDGFGNVGLSLPMSALPFVGGDLSVEVEEAETEPPWRARRVATFAELEPGVLGIMGDSWGQASLILNGASAAELLGAAPGDVVRLTRPGP
jgi:S-adenosylmethionine hydrolase